MIEVLSRRKLESGECEILNSSRPSPRPVRKELARCELAQEEPSQSTTGTKSAVRSNSKDFEQLHYIVSFIKHNWHKECCEI